MNTGGNTRNLGGSDRGVIEAAKDKTQGAIETVKDKSQNLASAVGDVAKTVKDKAKDGAAALAETAEKGWDNARDFAENVGTDVAHRAETAYADLVIFTRRNPVACLLGAFGIGLLMGMVLKPNRS